jgi:hypothetical protein
MMAPSVRAETPMEDNFSLVGSLGLDDPRLILLAKDVELIARQLKETGKHSSMSGAAEKRASGLKSLRLKSRALSSLATTLLRLKLELLIADCE